jgi:MFS transporter, PPP family, 3-phenylpropionic acid transporter
MPLVAMVTSPIWGIVADSLSDPRKVLRILLFLGPLSYVVVAVGDGFGAFLLLSVLLAAFYQPIIPVHDSLALRAVHRYGGDYGKMRIWGSLGFVVPSLLLPVLWGNPKIGEISWFVPAAIFAAYSVPAWLLSWSFPKVPPDEKHGFSLKGFSLFRNPSFVVLVVCVFLSRWGSSSLEGYQTLYFEEKGVPVRFLGLFCALGPLSEVVTIFYSQRWTAKFGAYRLMALCLATLVLRLIVTSLSDSLLVLFLLQVTHSLTFGMMYIVTVLVVNQLAGDSIRSSAQTLAVIFSNYLARLAGLFTAGWIADWLGLSKLFLVSSAIAAVALLFWLVFFRDSEETTLESGVR